MSTTYAFNLTSPGLEANKKALVQPLDSLPGSTLDDAAKLKPAVYLAQVPPSSTSTESPYGPPLVPVTGVVTTQTLVETALKSNPGLNLAKVKAYNSEVLLKGQQGTNYSSTTDVSLNPNAFLGGNFLSALPSFFTGTLNVQLAVSDPKNDAARNTKKALADFDALQKSNLEALVTQQVLSNYSDAQKFSLQVERAKLKLAAANQTFAFAENLVNAGVLTIDALSTLIEQQNKLNNDLSTAQDGLRVTLGNLELLTGLELKPENLLAVNQSKLWTYDKDLEARLGKLSPDVYQSALEEVVRTQNFDVQAAVQLINIAQLALREMQASTKPKVSGGFNILSVFKGLFNLVTQGPFSLVGTLLGGLFGRVEKKDGLELQQAIRKAQGDLDVAKAQLLGVARNVRVSIENPLRRVLKAAPNVSAQNTAPYYSYYSSIQASQRDLPELTRYYNLQVELFKAGVFKGNIVALYNLYAGLVDATFRPAELSIELQKQVVGVYYPLGLIRPGDPNAINLPGKLDKYPGQGVQVPAYPTLTINSKPIK